MVYLSTAQGFVETRSHSLHSTLPFYAILLAGVLLIMYIPWITMGPLEWFGK